MEVWEIGHWNVLEEDSSAKFPELPIMISSAVTEGDARLKQNSLGTESELVRADESLTDGASMVV